jgi:hypothetical protein
MCQSAPPDGRAAKHPRNVEPFLLIDANPIILFHRLGVVEYLRDTEHLIVEFQEQRRSGDNPPSRQFNSNPLAGVVSSITTNRIGGKQVLNYK